MFLKRSILCVPLLMGALAVPAVMASLPAAEELRSVAEIIEKLEKVSDNPVAHGVPAGKQDVLLAIGRYEKAAKAGADPMAEAAAWRAAAEAVFALERGRPDGFPAATMERLQAFAKRLPRPETWPHLAKPLADGAVAAERIGRRRPGPFGNDAGADGYGDLFEAISFTLSEDADRLKILYDRLITDESWHVRSLCQSLIKHLGAAAMDRTDVEWVLERYRSSFGSDEDSNSYHYLPVPNLVALIDDQEAVDAHLLALLKLNAENLRVRDASGSATRKRLKELLTEHRGSISQPHWSLIEGTDVVDLYEATIKMFPDDESGYDWHRQSAFQYYLASLLLSGKESEAAAALRAELAKAEAKENGSELRTYRLIELLDDKGRSDAAFTLLAAMFEEGPFRLSLWGDLADLAARSGRVDEAKALLGRVQERIGGPEAVPVRFAMVRLQLAKGSVEEGLAAFDALLAMEDVDADLRREFDSLRSRLSVVYPERYQIVFPGRDAFSDLSWYEIHDRVDRSLQSGSHAALQAFAMDWLAFDIAESGGQRRSSTTDRLLQLLMRIAMDNDDLDGAIRLMSDAPFWSKDYLVEDYDRDVLPPDYLARLIEGVHGTEQAVEFLTHAMAKRPGDDAIYRSLVDRLGGDALQLFQAQVERSPFEERPLIWMAQVHLDAGEAAKAEALCRQAIAVDPSDGEQGKGDRMRVYAVLAEALAAQGDDEQADFFRRVVASIRHSENADDWRRAGLASTAIKMYAKGIEMFSDAYCIQSRIAKELAEQGRWEEAQRHYQRAFELMPDSFGRMESHCFGCEGAFSGKLVQALAEKVFLGRIEKDEGNPRAHYLLGYLRLEQKDHEAALASFRRAVELDPDYINAWKRYAQVAASAGLSREEKLAINRALLRLDPYQEHVSIDTISSGFAEIWSDIDQRELPSEPPKPGKLLPLAKKPMNDRGMGFGFTSYRSHGSRGEAATAFQLFAQENPVIDLLNDKFSQFTR